MNEMNIILAGAEIEIMRVIKRINLDLFLAYCEARQPNTKPLRVLAKRRDIAPSWKAWWDR